MASTPNSSSFASTAAFRGLSFRNGTVTFTPDDSESFDSSSQRRGMRRSETEKLPGADGDSDDEASSPRLLDVTGSRRSLRPGPGRRRRRGNILTVFQSDPLVWRDAETGELHPIERPDFDREREMLRGAFLDAALSRVGAGGDAPPGEVAPSSAAAADVELEYEIATTDRLAAVLSTRGRSTVLHFSCHGLPDSLCFEDGTGGAQFLDAEGIRDLVSSGSGVDAGGGCCRLSLVFVAACHSLPAARAFLRAGAARVVCCRVDEPLGDTASAEFARSFYRAASCGRTVRESFDLARGAVRASPAVADAAGEAGKFLLLPEGGDHDVVLFGAVAAAAVTTSEVGIGIGIGVGRKEGRAPMLPRTESAPLPSLARLGRQVRPTCILPQPPQLCVGRQADVYRVVQGLLRARLVQITGPPGIGKGSVAAAACAYVSERIRSFAFECVYWLPLLSASRSDRLAVHLQDMFDLLRQERHGEYDISSDGEYRALRGEILEALYAIKSIVVIDTNDFLDDSRRAFLSVFLRDLFRGSRDVRVVIVSRYDSDFCLEHNGMEAKVGLDTLDFGSSATLFGAVCPHVSEGRRADVSTPRGFRAAVIRNEDEGTMRIGDAGLSRKSAEIFRRIGGGIPAHIYAAARSISSDQLGDMLSVAARPEVRVRSRVELERRFAALEVELRDAVVRSDYDRAKELRGELDELEEKRRGLPGIERLKKDEKDLEGLRSEAVERHDFEKAGRLMEEIDSVRRRIEEEKIALREVSEEEADKILKSILKVEGEQETTSCISCSDSREGGNEGYLAATRATIHRQLPLVVLAAMPISFLISWWWVCWWNSPRTSNIDAGINQIYTEALRRSAPTGESANGRHKILRPYKLMQFWRQIVTHTKL